MQSWQQVASKIAKCARVVTYDRPGTGRSPPRPGPEPVLADTVAAQLVKLLRTIDVEPPYVLVGHSLGGLYVQAFARGFPRDTAAVVLVDSASQFEPPGVFVSTQPPPDSTSAAEEAGFAPSVNAMLKGPPFPAVPLIVLSATNHGDTPEREEMWQDVQARTAALSPRGRLELATAAVISFSWIGRMPSFRRSSTPPESGADVLGCLGGGARPVR